MLPSNYVVPIERWLDLFCIGYPMFYVDALGISLWQRDVILQGSPESSLMQVFKILLGLMGRSPLRNMPPQRRMRWIEMMS